MAGQAAGPPTLVTKRPLRDLRPPRPAESLTFLVAAEVYRRAIVLDDSSAQLYLQLGTVLLSRGLWAEAVEALDQAVRLDPSAARAYTGRGLAQAGAGKLP